MIYIQTKSGPVRITNRLYTSKGQNVDGSMTQKAITDTINNMKYAGSDTIGGSATSAKTISTEEPTLAVGSNNAISIKKNIDGTFDGISVVIDKALSVNSGIALAADSSLIGVTELADKNTGKYALTNAIDYSYYSTHWQTGNVRDTDTGSLGYGFAFSEDGTTYRPVAVLTTQGTFATTKVQAEQFLGNLRGTADNVPWSGVTNKPSQFNPTSHTHKNADIESVSADKITGVIGIDHLPQGALDRLIKVADDEERFKLTTETVQLGDTVKVVSTGKMYYVIDESALSSEDGYEPYTADSATSVPWSGITGKPDVFPPETHNHDDRYYTESEVNDKLDKISEAIPTTMSWNSLTDVPASFPPSSHIHDDRYYTETEIDNKLKDKSPLKHTHTKSEITDFPESLKNPNLLTISINDGNKTSTETYDGSSAKTVKVASDVHTHKYAGSSESGGAATSAINISSENPTLAVGKDSNDISVKTNVSGSFDGLSSLSDQVLGVGSNTGLSIGGAAIVVSKAATKTKSGLYAMVNATDYAYHDSHWQIGNVRDTDDQSLGFGWAYSSSNSSYHPVMLLTPQGNLTASSFQGDTFVGNTFKGNLKGIADNVTWAGILNKPSTYKPASHTHAIEDITDFPETLSNPNKLVITLHNADSVTSNEYDGSEEVSLDLSADSLGAAPLSHSHKISDISELSTQLEDKAPKSHKHTKADITDFPDIPTLPTSLKNPNVLKINVSGMNQGAFRAISYDGSSEVSISVASDTHNHDLTYLKLSGGDVSGSILPDKDNSYSLGEYNALSKKAFSYISSYSVNADRISPFKSTSFIGSYINPWNSGYFKSMTVYGSSRSQYVAIHHGDDNGAAIQTTYLELGAVKNLSDSDTIYGYLDMMYGSKKVNLRPTPGSDSHTIYFPNAGGTLQMSSSDVRLKENIEDCDVDALSLINSIKIRQFDWKESGKGHQVIGFIADELQELDNNLAVGGGTDISEYEDKDGNVVKEETMNVKCVNSFYLQGYEVKAIQELAAENESLKEKITYLEGKVNRFLNYIMNLGTNS